MDIFDETIIEIKSWFRQKEQEGKRRHFDIPAPIEKPLVSISRPVQRKSVIVLKEDTRIELGHPSVGSCAATLVTTDSSLIQDGRVTLVGPDIPETDAKMIPFVQIAFACCKGDVKETSQKMDRLLHQSAQHEGYMIRSVPNLIWARVSKQAAEDGFSLLDLGHRLIKSLWHECKDISAVEILFVTTSREDVEALEKISAVAKEKLRRILSFEHGDDDTYECTSDNDCEVCPEQQVCDSIRDVIKLRKGDRIITFGREDT
jgi:CO dehydrogenase/acetyl-CoA synthase beta subunit